MTERISAAKSGALEFHAEGTANTKVRGRSENSRNSGGATNYLVQAEPRVCLSGGMKRRGWGGAGGGWRAS